MSLNLNIWLHNNPYDKKSEAKPHSDAILQQLLQNTLNTSKPVEIFKNTNGKPYINEPIYFSHSNSQNLYAYVISSAAEVAIDLEFMKPQRDVMKLASRHFHADEWLELKRTPSENRTLKFYQWWTKKEAWCKLDGGNLWNYLNRSVLATNSIKTQQGNLIQMAQINGIDGFAGMVACTQDINRIWINNIA